ncbi:hypothetical protein DFH11DRAFT_1729235 [Phellopilus nigrolimitatus]|nr:hypothetical protein DFH11DRAFT_1729235 [Phellopilus nigrolimitatus]
MEQTYTDALEQANVISRDFLDRFIESASGENPPIAAPGAAQADAGRGRVRAHCAVWKGGREKWLVLYKVRRAKTRERIVELLTTRHVTLLRIRRIYIPEPVIRLHALLVGSGDRIPRNLIYALDLANTVADSRYHLFEDFLDDDDRGADGSRDDGRTGVPHRRRLEDYLRAVRQAVLRGLLAGGSDPLRILHAA